MEKNDIIKMAEFAWEEYCLSKENDLLKLFPNTNLKNPVKLTDKLQWLKLHDSTFLKAYCADKITLRDYCKKKLGKDICIPILKIYDNPEQIEWDLLPNQFVIKCNHGSAMNIICKDKSKINKDRIIKTLKTWLKIKYGNLSYEMFYNLIKPKIFIEEYKEDKNNGALTDYKFICFNGKIKYLQVINGRFTDNLHFNYYDTNFNPMTNVSWLAHPARYDLKDKKPSNFNEMLDISDKLCKEFKCVRVDFYSINETLYLSELTFIPASGNIKYNDPKHDLFFGSMLSI